LHAQKPDELNGIPNRQERPHDAPWRDELGQVVGPRLAILREALLVLEGLEQLGDEDAVIV
jgi:hypothetical protein